MPKKVPPKKSAKKGQNIVLISMRTFKSAQKSAKKSAFANKSAQKSTLKITFGSSEPLRISLEKFASGTKAPTCAWNLCLKAFTGFKSNSCASSPQ